MRRIKNALVVVCVALALLLITYVIGEFPRLLLLPVAVLVIGYPIYVLRRTFSLRKRGYFVTNSRRHRVIYEERRGGKVLSIPIRTVPYKVGRDHVLVPTRAEWQDSAPDWAKDRRDEIFQRIIEAQPKGWAVLPDDWMA